MFLKLVFKIFLFIFIAINSSPFTLCLNTNWNRHTRFPNSIFNRKLSNNALARNRDSFALIPFESSYFGFFKKRKPSGFNIFKWASDNNGEEKKIASDVVTNAENVQTSCTPSGDPKCNDNTSVYQKILEGSSSNLFLLSDTFGGNNDVNVKIGKEQANRLSLMTGDFVRVRGRRRKETICGVDVKEEIKRNEVVLHEDVRRNLRLRLGDVVSINKIKNIPDVKIVYVLPFKDTIDPLVKQLSNQNEEYDEKKVRAVLKNFKVLKIKTLSKQFENLLVDTDVGFIVGDSIIDHNGPFLSREHDDKSYGEIGYDDIGGMTKQLGKIRELIELPLLHPELFTTVGISPPKGVILHGPPGCGKTLVARAIANETGAKCYVINGPEIMSKMVGESEENLRNTFENASKNGPAIIFIDEIDSIAGKRSKVQGELERRLVSQLLTLMDGINTVKANKGLVVIAATNRINSIDNALRRFGRFDREIEMASCDEKERYEILKVKTKNMRLDSDVDLHKIAKECHGYVGADIAQLCFEAAMSAIKDSLNSSVYLQYYCPDEIPQEVLNSLVVKSKHFEEALSLCNPSSLREKIVEIPETTWNDVGGLEGVKKELIETIQYPLLYPEKFTKYGQSSNKGVLFYGPPGCGKTLLAKAIAHECNANFISIKGPELLTMWFGESEANVRELFDKARASAPCILFFDEIDSIAKARSRNGVSGQEAADRVINQILTEIDGINVKKPIFIIAATNRHVSILRPGRLGKLIYIPLPDAKSRENIFKAALRNSPVSPDVDIAEMADALEGYSGADIAEVCHRAALEAIRESIEEEIKRRRPLEKGEKDPVPYITKRHFQIALKNSRKSVEKNDIELYESFKNKHAV
ncbi:cell division cycle CDC48 homologue/transitional endoplasmic reticulum ATPase [Theileria orientalis strain Shintoku]|uniref:Cell division cycle CDC48 homologue/transitional endoplasmic reticulum ATPase n=1 Tax=Theileria orientalis strain Shintoku TaxID=869250 RepID=J4C8N5_THEOR|nr:cell division cycle CDC48 homologue/transitional endoplasmic reticulum ATPase [Theileria orientalis strain Shintoku]BAM41098.1 cell division cycle CDC48 homologue/transitional endoplasmic reticulum ATPase [Theileria orientalis strain Shintoku]|eukprot:XP_009691399.1 cell division cycle CDC48 homologue/transitional endoplasmic reticulum ATPase [Theileria orientalis strain Shintoku]